MFYQKYRPQTFSEISKPNDVAVALMNQVKSKKVGHAYLFIGPRGTGKTTTARILAKALNCKKLTEDGDPCDTCQTCTDIKNGKFIDLIEIDAASNRGIDDIRSLKEKINLSSMSSDYKVYIIDEVHMLTLEAFNALLKTLEEPPKHAVFILCTTEAHKVPDTIKSRCQVFKFKRAGITQIVDRLQWILDQEDKELSKEELKRIATASYGGFRDADTLLQQVLEGSISVKNLIGVDNLEGFINITNTIMAGQTQAALTFINRLHNDGVDLVNWSNEYIRYLRDLLYIHAGFTESKLGVGDELFAQMEEQACKFTTKELVKFIETFIKASNEIKISPLPELPLELAIVELLDHRSSGAFGFSNFSGGPTPKNNAVDDSDDTKSSYSNDSDMEAVPMSLQSVLDQWVDVLKEIKPFNHSVEALLKSCHPIDLTDNCLTLEVSYAFHKERLESAKNREIVEKVLSGRMGTRVKVVCALRSREGEALTDHNIVMVTKEEPVVKNVLDVFDGELVLDM